ncbi:heat shock protein Hsp18 [Fonticella tunisiensis]|uniref:Heat shock protein Hsp20 n=1 Tax=Fonticella tunisiensis TaxID=1096341 RepID=A0A4R7KD65_9CLOT|nr:heat shock protein Hsp18 [Fonticella tunisiensis]TDT51895.1 heat shock protein Hsp20 [Fonticella tunisiensis]
MFGMVPYGRNRGIPRRGNYFDDFFGNFFTEGLLPSFDFMNNNFRVDLRETDDAYMVEADLPGVSKDSIDIDYENNYLTISAKRKDIVEDKRDDYVRRERYFGELRRSFYMENVDESKITASFENGVLKVTLPKMNKGKGKRKIEIQ